MINKKNKYYIPNSQNFKALLVLREISNVNIFRKLYLKLISNFVWDELFLTSWFIESNNKYSVLTDKRITLFNAFKKNWNKNICIKTLWIYNSSKKDTDYNNYTHFIDKLKNDISKLKIYARIISNFHAKTLGSRIQS